MQKWLPGGIICVLLMSALFFSGCSSTEKSGPVTGTPAWSHSVPTRMTPGELKALVQDAAAYARTVGQAAALAEFMKKDGRYTRGNVYVFAASTNGTVLSHLYQQGEIGQFRRNFTDIRGLPLMAITNYTAMNGGGFAVSLYPAPRNGVIDEEADELYIPKIHYAYPVDWNWWISAGVYFDDLSGPDAVPEPVESMIQLVKESADFGRKAGKDLAYAEISNRSGIFVDGEGHYVYAYDYNGTLLAHPYLQDQIGSNLIGRWDPFGMESIRALCDTARSGGGYVAFIWPNPDAGNRQEMKIGYVLPVDEQWWVGSGVYLSEITGEPFYYPDQVA